MAHRIYHTQGIILRSIPMGESNKFLFILTQDLGRIGVMVQSVRTLSSKLRFVLQDYSFVNLDLVRGRSVWRLTSAQAVHMSDTTQAHKHRVVTARICSLVHRLCPEGEDAHGLWHDVQHGLSFLQHTDLGSQEVRLFEIVMAMKVLNHLGYWGEDEQFQNIIEDKDWSKEILERVQPHAPRALTAIRNALTHSHL